MQVWNTIKENVLWTWGAHSSNSRPSRYEIHAHYVQCKRFLRILVPRSELFWTSKTPHQTVLWANFPALSIALTESEKSFGYIQVTMLLTCSADKTLERCFRGICLKHVWSRVNLGVNGFHNLDSFWHFVPSYNKCRSILTFLLSCSFVLFVSLAQ